MKSASAARRAAVAVRELLGAAKRAQYRGGRPRPFMRLWNRLDAKLYSSSLLHRQHTASLKVCGRRSGRTVAVPVVVADVSAAEYLVSMLGPGANWVRNVEAAGGHAVLRRRGRDIPVRLDRVPVNERAPILRRYVAIAPGARPHLGLGAAASLEEFTRIAPNHPVYRIGELPE